MAAGCIGIQILSPNPKILILKMPARAVTEARTFPQDITQKLVVRSVYELPALLTSKDVRIVDGFRMCMAASTPS
jgi:hypothetical protein